MRDIPAQYVNVLERDKNRFLIYLYQGTYTGMSPTIHERILDIDKYNTNKY